MKSLKLFSILLTLFSFTRCSKDRDPSPRDQKMNLLTADVWVTEHVSNTADGDLTHQYADFAIAFVKNQAEGFEGDYYLAHGSYAFPELYGKWKFSDDLKKLVLQKGREMKIELTENSMTLSFYMAPVNGRGQGLSGNFIFQMKKKLQK